MTMKKRLSLLLAVVLVLSLVACAQDGQVDTTEPSESQEQTQQTLPQVEVENPATFFSLSLSLDPDEYRYLTVFPNEDGTARVEWGAEIKKSGVMDGIVLHAITAELEKTDLPSLNGQDVYGDGPASASMYIEFADGSTLTVGYSGEIPEEFITGYETMAAYFELLTQDMPVYVPQPVVSGEVDQVVLEQMLAILNDSGIEELDTMMISEAPKDEFFAMTLGLSSDEGILCGVSCGAMMMTTPYSLVIVTVEDQSDVAAVRKDFEKSMDWRKWVCVSPSNAMIAQKDNMVLCLVGSGSLYSGTARAAEKAGWTDVLELENPDMG